MSEGWVSEWGNLWVCKCISEWMSKWGSENNQFILNIESPGPLWFSPLAPPLVLSFSSNIFLWTVQRFQTFLNCPLILFGTETKLSNFLWSKGSVRLYDCPLKKWNIENIIILIWRIKWNKILNFPDNC